MENYKADDKVNYRDMYYHLSGRMSVAIEALDGLVAIVDGLKKAQQTTEEIFLRAGDEGE